jgi:serine/threonine-protein kinase
MSGDLVGQTLGEFRIEAKLGQGGMGAVYRATQLGLDRPVALKLLPKHLAAETEFRERFLREAKKLAQMTHANMVQVFTFGTVDGHTYMAMQLMTGGSLQDLLAERGRLEPREAARIVREAARGLARAAREGIVHRDIKPANILLSEDGEEVRLGDFGLVKQVGGGDQPLTQTGMVLGTPHYMAPEQCEGLEDIDQRADLYALGLVLYQCLSGTLPAKGTTPLQIITHRLREDPPPLCDVAPHVPSGLAQVVEELLVRDREQRLSSAGELVERLDRFLGSGADPTQLETVHIPAPGADRVPTARIVNDEEPGVLPQVEEEDRPPSGRLIHDDDPRERPPPAPPQKTQQLVLWIGGCLAFGVLAFFCLIALAAIGQERGY